MADTRLPVFNNDGQTAYVDVRTESTNGEGRQVITFGDPSVNDNVARVATQDLGGSDQTTPGVVFRLAGSAAVQIAGATGTIGVYLHSSAGTFAVQFQNEPTVISSGKQGTTTRPFIMNTDGAIKIYDIVTGTINTVAAVTSITNSIAVHLLSTGGTQVVSFANEPTVVAAGKQGTTTRHFIANSDGAMKIYDIVTGTINTVAAITNITNSIAVHLVTTGGTMQVKIDPASAGLARDDSAYTAGTSYGFPMMAVFDDSSPDSVDENDAGIVRMTGNRIQMMHTDSTASIFVASGTVNGVSASGNTIISPSANASFKVYAYSIQTTAQVSLTCTFTNGGGSATEFGRPLITASGVTGAQGANLSTGGPGSPLFATGVSTTLALRLDSASLVHYTVWYTKESA